MKNLKGFTLAETMITLVVIGIIVAVIIPVMNNSKPDKNLIKFKKANETLYQTIQTLITSNKYYLNGDLGMKPDGSAVDFKTKTSDATYLCRSLAENLTVKKTNCSSYFTKSDTSAFFCTDWVGVEGHDADVFCKKEAKNIGEEIVLRDGVVLYQMSPGYTFGYSGGYLYNQGTKESARNPFYQAENKSRGEMYRCSKVICIDVDGIPSGGSENCDDVKDICPFAYSIRIDGKISPHRRASEWIEKSLSK